MHIKLFPPPDLAVYDFRNNTNRFLPFSKEVLFEYCVLKLLKIILLCEKRKVFQHFSKLKKMVDV